MLFFCPPGCKIFLFFRCFSTNFVVMCMQEFFTILWGHGSMKKFLKTRLGKLCIALLVLFLLLGCAFGSHQHWLYQQPKFQDVTIELGTTSLGIDQFTTQYATIGKCRFVSDVSTLDIGKPGAHHLTLSHGNQEQTVTLTPLLRMLYLSPRRLHSPVTFPQRKILWRAAPIFPAHLFLLLHL